MNATFFRNAAFFWICLNLGVTYFNAIVFRERKKNMLRIHVKMHSGSSKWLTSMDPFWCAAYILRFEGKIEDCSGQFGD